MPKYNKFKVDNTNNLTPDNVYVDVAVKNLTNNNRSVFAEF